MRHWIGRVDIPSGNITPLSEVNSPEDAWEFIHRTNSQQDQINKENKELKIAKDNLPFDVPAYDKEVHGNLGQYIKLKVKLKQKAKAELSSEDREIYHKEYTKCVIPKNTKLVYMAIHEPKDLE